LPQDIVVFDPWSSICRFSFCHDNYNEKVIKLKRNFQKFCEVVKNVVDAVTIKYVCLNGWGSGNDKKLH